MRPLPGSPGASSDSGTLTSGVRRWSWVELKDFGTGPVPVYSIWKSDDRHSPAFTEMRGLEAWAAKNQADLRKELKGGADG